MCPRFFLVLILVSALFLPASAQEGVDPRYGPVEVKPDVEENVMSVPVDEETGTVDWDQWSDLPAGGGAKFGFVTTLYPPDPAALANTPEILLDTAWYPPIPFAFGFSPPAQTWISTRGWFYLEDASGSLARRDTDITIEGLTSFCSTWFLGGTRVFHVEEGWQQGYLSERNYMPDEWSGGGIDFFLRCVWFRGILGGERMEKLLEVCGARQIGRDYIHGGRDRLLIYQIPPNEIDRQNGRGNLLVWLTIGDWRIMRTRLHAAYATEVTEYRMASPGVQNDPIVFYDDFLPSDIYWSIDQYLLTHEMSFIELPPEGDVFGPSSFPPAEALVGAPPQDDEQNEEDGSADEQEQSEDEDQEQSES
jgi:hypothetical protein